MALTNSCSSGLLVTAVLAVLLFPVQYYLPGYTENVEPLAVTENLEIPYVPQTWYEPKFQLASLDLIVSLALILVGILTYLCEWIQRKLMERRLMELNKCLYVSLERLRSLDAQQDKLEANLKMVQSATSEYNLLLYLLLRRHRLGRNGPLSGYCFEKDLDETRLF